MPTPFCLSPLVRGKDSLAIKAGLFQNLKCKYYSLSAMSSPSPAAGDVSLHTIPSPKNGCINPHNCFNSTIITTN